MRNASPRALGAAWPGIWSASSGARGTHREPLPTSQPHRRNPMMFNRDDPKTWGCFRPLIIAHDVGRSRDSSTAVIVELAPIDADISSIRGVNELRPGT